MNEKRGNYNLLEERWIPVLMTDGRFCRLGIKDALTQAGRIRQIAASNPMDRVAILRFLLALLYWCRGNPPQEGSVTSVDSFPADWFSKLDDNKDCFNLLGDGKRFYQDCTAQRPQAVTQLIQEIPAGNNFWHFRHSTDKRSGLCPACCAMGLLRLPLFSVSGLSGPKEPNLMAGINGVPPVYVVPWEKSLFSTLLANWATCTNIGEPSWIQPGIGQIQNNDVPLLAGLTLLSRRVLLHDPVKESVTCIGCGEKTAVILTCEFQTAGKQENDKWNDPHVVYLDRKPRKTLRGADLTSAGKFRMDRPWPDLLARIVETRKPVSLLIVGFATNKAKNVDVWERLVTVPQNHSNSTSLYQWQDKSRGLEDWLREIVRGRRKTRKDDARIAVSAIAAIRPHVEGRVSSKVGELLAGGDDAWERAAREYRPMMCAIASSLSPGFTTAAVERRQQIASVMPNMRQKQIQLKKNSRKKGGDK
ncbi:MAG: type I-E CRISPR-associated protein Cse1/CasA [Nitrospinae bacterium]|nr:type I-E CRISPR-associated protein Cse1/CasA [Nitrospinota bacterium]